LCNIKPTNLYIQLILFLAVIITSSETTDETIVADSDVETDTAISDRTVGASKSEHHIQHISDNKAEGKVISGTNAANLGEVEVNTSIHVDLEKDKISESMEEDVQVIEKTAVPRFKAGGEDVQVINKVLEDENIDTTREKTSHAVFVNKALKDENLGTSGEETCHVIFSQNLIVKRVLRPARAASAKTGGINFKRFKKVCSVGLIHVVLLAQNVECQHSTKFLTFQLFRGKPCLETASGP
jgi:nijmegen breakage syndrome protein 1